MLKVFWRVLAIFTGVFAGVFLAMYGFGLYQDVYRFSPLYSPFLVVVSCVAIGVVNIIQLSILMLATRFTLKRFRVRFTPSLISNIAIAFVFSATYFPLGWLIDDINIPETINFWLQVAILPIIILLPLMSLDYLVMSHLRQKEQ